ncbi:MAG: metallophosphoesterase [Ignavibacteriae bacterium]|nr:metallophosphoesterase [Ignavibacteriota bacterium]
MNDKRIQDQKKIILSHHHFYKNNFEAKSSNNDIWNKIEGYTLKLRGNKKLLKLFSDNNVDLILHGHSHENKCYSRFGIKIFNAGGSIDNEDTSFYLNYIETDKMEINSKKLLFDLQESFI